MAFSIQQFVIKLLTSHPEERFTARQIAEWIMLNYPAECEDKRARSRAQKIPLDTSDALRQQIVAEIGAQRLQLQKKHPEIQTTEGRPRRYYYSRRSAEEQASSLEPLNRAPTSPRPEPFAPEQSGGDQSMAEAELYPILSVFLASEHGVYSKRIDERRSRNQRGRGGNKWLYPDVVGMEDLSWRWHREIRDCAGAYADKKTRLWSFEVKRLLNASNVRESYFQAVSNSSWANFGYLVAAEITGPDTIRELRMLSGLHGLGVILLNAENLTESQITIPSRERPDIDWDAANRLAEENDDFIEYIRLIRQFYQTGDPRGKDWDAQPRRT